MRRWSIKLRVALWYAFSLLAILVLVAALLLAVGDRLILDENISNLTTVTDRAVGDVWILNGNLTIDDDISYYSDGASVVIYRDDRTLISGLIPDGFEEMTEFAADKVRRIGGGQHAWYVYDRLIENQRAGKIWVRGVTSARLMDMAPAVMKMILGFLIVLPVLFLIALAGGWALTRQAFYPLTRIVDTAEEIRTGGDLSRRIGFGSKEDSDEVSRTAAVFDEMLDQIESNFEMEKRFTNDASHELRTPIAVILAQSEYALENPEDAQEVRESLEEIHLQAGRMSSLVSQLLTMARADRGIEQLKCRPADISLLAEESAARFQGEAERRGICLKTEAEEGCYLNCDPLFIGRMFDNLIDNSLKYGKRGGNVLVRVKRESDGILAAVKDDGVGIPEEDLPRIWERFFRGDRSGGRMSAMLPGDESRSMGLGLPMVKWIVEAHGGGITVESRPGEGSVFRMTFPV